MSDSIFYCKNCTTNVMCHMERKCMRQAHGSPAPNCSASKDFHQYTYKNPTQHEWDGEKWVPKQNA